MRRLSLKKGSLAFLTLLAWLQPIPADALEAPDTSTKPTIISLADSKPTGETSSGQTDRTIHIPTPRTWDLLIHADSLDPHTMDAEYNQLITLREALSYARQNNLPIKISGESWNFQRYQYYAYMGLMLPSNTLSWSLLHSHVYPTNTLSMSRVFSEAVSFPVFQGGGIVYSTMSQYYRSKGWHHAYHASTNDALLSVYKSYTELIQQRAVLEIRSRAVAVSRFQMALNASRYAAGAGTRFAVVQSKAQLEADNQALLEQQVACRRAALDLAFHLNMPLGVNLIPAERNVPDPQLVDKNARVNALINDAIAYRPELRQFELFRLAAARTVNAIAASYYPSVNLFALFTHTSTTVSGNPLGLAGVANQNIAANQSSGIIPAASSNALGQQASFSATGSTTGNAGANTSAATTVAGGGGSPTASLQSGGLVTSGGVAPTLVNAFGTPFNFINGTTVGAGVFPGMFNNFQIGLQLNWVVPYAYVPTTGSVLAARALARQALEQSNQELQLVTAQVRTDLMNITAARKLIDAAAAEVAASEEAWRMAYARLKVGASTNLELIKAERQYTQAQIKQVNALVRLSEAQAQLLHDTGTISVEALTREPGGVTRQPSS